VDNMMPNPELGVTTGWLALATSSAANAPTFTYRDPRYRRVSEGGAVLYDGLAWGDIYNAAARVDADGLPIPLDLTRQTYDPFNQRFLRWYSDKLDRVT